MFKLVDKKIFPILRSFFFVYLGLCRLTLLFEGLHADVTLVWLMLFEMPLPFSLPILTVECEVTISTHVEPLLS